LLVYPCAFGVAQKVTYLKDFLGFAKLTVWVISCRSKNPKKSFIFEHSRRSRDDSTDVLGLIFNVVIGKIIGKLSN